MAWLELNQVLLSLTSFLRDPRATSFAILTCPTLSWNPEKCAQATYASSGSSTFHSPAGHPPIILYTLEKPSRKQPQGSERSPEGAPGRCSGRCVEARLVEMLWKCQTSFHFFVEQNPGCWSVQPCDQKTFVQSSEVMCGWAGIFGGP